METTFAYVGTHDGGMLVCYHIPIGGVLLLEHPRHAGRPNVNMFEWGTVNNRSYFLAQTILEHSLKTSRQVTVSNHMIECFQREVIAKAAASQRMRIEEVDLKQWIREFLAREGS